MKIIYVNTPMQDDNTKNPQLIEGKYPHWCVKTEWAKKDHTLRQFFEDKWNWVKQKPNGHIVEGFYLYDVQPVHGIIDKDKKFTGQSAFFVRFDYIKKE